MAPRFSDGEANVVRLGFVMAERSEDPISHLYVHVPFCAQKCSYCAFYSEPASGEVIDRYVGALIRELELVAGDLKPRTIFFGGGTPSLLNMRQWKRVLQAMDRLKLAGADEWTVECNPATVSLEKARMLRDWGVDRVSMGVQSLDNQLLDCLGRIHTREMAFKSYDTLRAAGFENVNLDLMFAIPGQTLHVWRETLREVVAMGSEHLSCYEVTYEEDTALYNRLRAGHFDADEDSACAMYEELVEAATAGGFDQYEVSNFARTEKAEVQASSAKNPGSASALQGPNTRAPGTKPEQGEEEAVRLVEDRFGLALPKFACRHNTNYWRGGSFYGAGPSATSYVRGVRRKNWSDTRLYCERLEDGELAIGTSEQLSPLGRAGETAAFGLRMLAGWPFEQFRKVTGYDLQGEWAAEIEELTRRGWGRISADRFQLTNEGIRFADAAAQLFLR